MEYKIYPISKDNINDFLYFFDNIAFSDHKEWEGCYCVFYHILENDKQIDRRELAIELIKQNKLCGYLVYLNDSVVGWCNVSDKESYPLLVSDKTLWDEKENDKKIKSIVCFTIAPSMRSKGIATQLLTRICSDAKNENYDFIEGYPIKKSKDNFHHYRGPVNLYKKFDFELYKEFPDDYIYRKYLK